MADAQRFRHRRFASTHGDAHSYRVDRPLSDVNGRRIDNFIRLEVPG